MAESPESEDLRALRRDLDELLVQANRIARRIEVLEQRSEAGSRAAQQPIASQPPVTPQQPPQPPPLPPVAKLAPPSKTTVAQEPPVQKAPAPPFAPPEPMAPHRQPAPAAAAETAAAKTGSNWELSLGTKLMPIIGVAIIAIAVVFAVAWAAQHSGPRSRVATGYTICAALLVLGWRLEARFPNYARILLGGGFALSYFVTYAAHFIDYARVIESQTLDLALLAGVVGAWTVVAQKRQSSVIAALVTFLGHFTVWLSGPGRHSVAGLILLSAGSAYFLLRNRWYYVACLGIAGSYFNHTLWMFHNAGAHRDMDFWISLSILGGYFLIFAVAELLSPEEVRRKAVPTWFRTGFVTLNSASFFSLATILVYSFDFARPHKDLFCFGYALVLLGLGYAYLKLRKADPLYNVYVTKAVAVATVGLAARYSANTLSAWLAIETVVLLVSARRSGLVVTRILAFFVAILAFVQAMFTVLAIHTLHYGDPGFLARLAQSAIAVVAFYAASLFYQRTNWSTRAPLTLPIGDANCLSLWRLDLLGECPARYAGARKPFSGLLFPYLYVLGGTVLFIAFKLRLGKTENSFLVFSAFALAMTAAAAVLRSKPYGLASLIGVTAALLSGTIGLALDGHTEARVAALSVVLLASVALASESWLVGKCEGLEFHQSASAPYFLYGITGFLTGLTLVERMADASGTAALAVAASLFAALFVALHPRALAGVAVALYVWAQMRWLVQYDVADLAQRGLPDWGKHIGLALVVAPLAADRLFAWGKLNRANVSAMGGVLVVTSWFILQRYAAVLAPDAWEPFWWALVGFAFLGYAGAFRSVIAGIMSVIGIALTSMYSLYWAYATPRLWDGAVPALAASFLALVAFWIAGERLCKYVKPDQRAKIAVNPEAVAVSALTILLLVLLERIPQISSLYLIISWTLLALALFGTSLAFTQKFYRYAGLVVFGLSVLRALILVIAAKDLELIYKIAAMGVLGIALLGVSYGYNIAMERLNPPSRPSPSPAKPITEPAAPAGPPPIPSQKDEP